MKSLKFTVLSLTALLLGRIPQCCTANAAADSTPLPPEFQKQLDDQAAEIAALKKQLSIPTVAEPAAGTLGFLAKGAGVDLDDVRWRVQAGLDPETAVQAALAQKEHDEKAKAAKEAADKKKK